jgi:hypothetical protein
MARGRAAVGVAVGTMLAATPVYSHVGTTVSHLWSKHIRPLTDTRYANAVPGTDKARNADKLDGKDAAAFYAVGSKVEEAAHADSAARAGDAETLDGRGPEAFAEPAAFAIIRHVVVPCSVPSECPPSGDKLAPVIAHGRGVLEVYDEKDTTVATNDVTVRFDRPVHRCAIIATAEVGAGSHALNHYVTTKEDWTGSRDDFRRVLVWKADGSPAPIEGGDSSDFNFTVVAIC